MINKTLFACEATWEEQSGELAEWSMQPFFQGLAMLYGFRFLYRTFTSRTELQTLLETGVPDGASTSKIVYIGSHGYGGRLADSSGRGINLKPIAASAHRHIEGVWLSACDAGSSSGLRDFLLEGGAVWAGGYTCVIPWDSAMLIDLAIMNAIMSSRPANSKESAAGLFATALRSFDPNWEVGERGGEKVVLRNAIRLEARDQVQGSRAKDITDLLMERLRWSDDKDRLSA